MKIFAAVTLVFALLMASATAVYAGGSNGFNSGHAFPYISTDEDSVEFLVEAILYSMTWDAYHAALADYEEKKDNGEDPDEPEKPDEPKDEVEDALKANYYRYAEELAKTLSQLSPSAQNGVWYGS